jgi:protein-S-isoprenylcysteine O-methyltransferase Ste14
VINAFHSKLPEQRQPVARPGSEPLFGFMGKLRGVIALLGTAAVLFVPAGRLDLPMFWAFWLTLWSIGGATLLLVNRKFPGLLQERFRPGPGARDPKTRPLMVLFILVQWCIAGLDVGRYHWADIIPLGMQITALLVVACGVAGWGWAMLSNRFFSSEVRIQTDRGHYVESGGPYRFVRHPGYASALLLFAASPVALGSLWAIVPTLGALAMFIRRTAMEDRMLRAELAGYAQYAERVRFRLLSGVW